MKRAIWIFAVFSLLFGGLAASVAAQAAPDGVPKSAETATVSSVPNGGTLVVITADGAQRNVGLIGVSAPTVPTATDPGQCYGEEARLYLESLAIPGTVVYLEADGKVKESDETLLRHVWIVPADGGKPFLANTKMVRDGYADVGQGGNKSKYAKRLSQGAAGAKEAGKGAWGACGQIHKPNPLTEEMRLAQYQAADIRDVDIRPGDLLGQKVTFSGSVLSIHVASPGRVLVLGDSNPQDYKALIQVTVTAVDGSRVTVCVGYDGDTSGIYEDTWITVYGTVVDVLSFTNGFGGDVTQTLIAGDQVNIG